MEETTKPLRTLLQSVTWELRAQTPHIWNQWQVCIKEKSNSKLTRHKTKQSQGMFVLCFKSNNVFFISKWEKIYYFCKWLTSGNNLGDQQKGTDFEWNLCCAPKPRCLHSGISTTAVDVAVPSPLTRKFRLSSWTHNCFPMLDVIVASIATAQTSLLDMIWY